MYNVQQQQTVPTQADLMNRLTFLQRQLIETNGNQYAQQQIVSEINMINQALGMYAQQNALQQQYRVPQQVYQNQAAISYGRPVVYQGGVDSSAAPIDDSRYSDRSHVQRPAIVTQATQVAQQQEVKYAAPIVNYKPLEGNELPFLLADGYQLEKEYLGEYYRWKITQTLSLPKPAKQLTIIDDIDVIVNKVTEGSKALLSPEDKLAIVKSQLNKSDYIMVTPKTESVMVESSTPEFFLQYCKTTAAPDTTLGTLVSICKSGVYRSELSDVLRSKLTDLFNLYVGCSSFTKLETNDFVEDYEEILGEANSSPSMFTKLNHVFGMMLRDIKTNKGYATAVIKVTDDIHIVRSVENQVTVNLNDDELDHSVSVQLDTGDKIITRESHPVLFDVANKTFAKYGDSVNYFILKMYRGYIITTNINNTYTITKG